MKSIISVKFSYKFSELADDVKDKVIEKWYETEDYPFLADDLTESLRDKAPYWQEPKLQYSLSYCQGDGLSFSARLDIPAFLAIHFKDHTRRKAIENYIYKISALGNRGRYCFASENDIEMECQYNHKEFKRLDKLADHVLEMAKSDYMGLCHDLQKEGYAALEYRMTHEEFADHADANDYQYLEDGRQFNN